MSGMRNNQMMRRHAADEGECRYCDRWWWLRTVTFPNGDIGEPPEKRDGMMPRHDASARCESGQRKHCTCDTCY